MSHISRVNYDLCQCMNIPGDNLFEYMNWDLLSLSTWNETYLCKYMNLDLLLEYMNWNLIVWIHELGLRLIVWVHEMQLICLHASFSSKSKDWLSRNQNIVSEWSNISVVSVI
jgi:hypothetical protein